MVSNCVTNSEREDYVDDLSNFIPVDIYGYCGKLKCTRGWQRGIFITDIMGQFHQHAYTQLLFAQIPTVQKDSQVISRKKVDLLDVLLYCSGFALKALCCALKFDEINSRGRVQGFGYNSALYLKA